VKARGIFERLMAHLVPMPAPALALVPACRCAGQCRCGGMTPALLLREIELECEFFRTEM